MSAKLEILSQVVLSLKVDQSNIMHNINTLLNNSRTELDLVERVKSELGALSLVHAKMQECESFMLQIAQSTISQGAKNVEKTDSSEDTEKDSSKDLKK